MASSQKTGEMEKQRKKHENFLLFLFLLFFFPVYAFNPPHQPLFTHCTMMAMWHQAKENNFISVLFSLIIIIMYPPNIHAHYHVVGYLHINDVRLDCRNARVVIIDLLFDDINHSDESRKRRPQWPDGRGWSGRRVRYFLLFIFLYALLMSRTDYCAHKITISVSIAHVVDELLPWCYTEQWRRHGISIRVDGFAQSAKQESNIFYETKKTKKKKVVARG